MKEASSRIWCKTLPEFDINDNVPSETLIEVTRVILEVDQQIGWVLSQKFMEK